MELDWLKRVKDSHGSVEVNALASAREINEKGIFSVGNLSTSEQSACRKVCCSLFVYISYIKMQVLIACTIQTDIYKFTILDHWLARLPSGALPLDLSGNPDPSI